MYHKRKQISAPESDHNFYTNLASMHYLASPNLDLNLSSPPVRAYSPVDITDLFPNTQKIEYFDISPGIDAYNGFKTGGSAYDPRRYSSECTNLDDNTQRTLSNLKY